MRKFTIPSMFLSFLFVGCVSKWADAPEKEMVLDGYPMALRVLHAGPEFEVLTARNDGVYMVDILREKRLAVTAADSEAAAICGSSKPRLLLQEKLGEAPWWVSRYRCD